MPVKRKARKATGASVSTAKRNAVESVLALVTDHVTTDDSDPAEWIFEWEFIRLVNHELVRLAIGNMQRLSDDEFPNYVLNNQSRLYSDEPSKTHHFWSAFRGYLTDLKKDSTIKPRQQGKDKEIRVNVLRRGLSAYSLDYRQCHDCDGNELFFTEGCMYCRKQ